MLISSLFGNVIALLCVVASLILPLSTGIGVTLFILGVLLWLYIIAVEKEIKIYGLEVESKKNTHLEKGKILLKNV